MLISSFPDAGNRTKQIFIWSESRAIQLPNLEQIQKLLLVDGSNSALATVLLMTEFNFH